MQTVALLVTHHTKAGERDRVRAVWQRHMAPAVSANPGHLAYFYTYDAADPDTIHAFQHYRSDEDAAAFLRTDAYRAYEREVASLLVSTEVTRLSPVWIKQPA